MNLLIINIIFYLYVFILGLVVGSFLNVVIYRLPLGISIAKGRSFCPDCKNPIKAQQNIPLFSFIFLRGRCGYCGQKISFRYPLVELLTGLLAMLSFFVFGLSFQFIIAFITTALLISIAFIDLDKMTIPNSLVIALILPALASFFIFPEINLISRLIGVFIVSAPMLLLTFIIPDAFGGGDIKLMTVAGFMLGFANTLLATFIALILGGGIAIFYLIKKTDEKHMAFGPYLCMGIFISQHFGGVIIRCYFSLFGL